MWLLLLLLLNDHWNHGIVVDGIWRVEPRRPSGIGRVRTVVEHQRARSHDRHQLAHVQELQHGAARSRLRRRRLHDMRRLQQALSGLLESQGRPCALTAGQNTHAQFCLLSGRESVRQFYRYRYRGKSVCSSSRTRNLLFAIALHFSQLILVLSNLSLQTKTYAGRIVGTLTQHFQNVTCVKFSIDLGYLITASDDTTILVWSLDE